MKPAVSDCRFHLAFTVDDLAAARRFYGELLGCPEGRSSARWVDFNFADHQITAHLVDAAHDAAPTNPVDGENVPARHFGLVLAWTEWEHLVDRIRDAGHPFRIEPQVRFTGQVGEQATFFVDDPAGNSLEFKAFRRPEELFRPRP